MLTNQVDNLVSRIKLLIGNISLPPVILCIGSDRVTGDCLGPLVGHILKTGLNTCAYVYGDLNQPVTALNLVETLRFVKHRHRGCPIIAVDSSVGTENDIGKIRVISEGIYPGAATNKTLPKVGDIAITATVATLDKNELYGVRLGLIYPLAEKIAEALNKSLSAA